MSQSKYLVQAFLTLAAFAVAGLFVERLLSVENVKTGPVDFAGSKSENVTPSKGKQLFNQLCASCHNLYKDMTGPSLAGFEERGPWSDRKKLYEWIKNPASFIKNDDYTQSLQKKYGSLMQGFPDLPETAIDEIVNYINENSSDLPEPGIAYSFPKQ